MSQEKIVDTEAKEPLFRTEAGEDTLQKVDDIVWKEIDKDDTLDSQDRSVKVKLVN